MTLTEKINHLPKAGYFYIGVLVLLTSCGAKDLSIPVLKIESPACPSTYDSVSISATVKARTGLWTTTKPNKLSLRFEGDSNSYIFDIPKLHNNQEFTLSKKYLFKNDGSRTVKAKVDTDSIIKENNEFNNTRSIICDIAYYPILPPAANVVFNENLATILRGVVIHNSNLNIPMGYYHIREFRVWNSPNKKAIALCFIKNYAELVAGNSVLPAESDPWVFSIIKTDVYQSGYRKFLGYDRSGHSLGFEMKYDFIKKCWRVNLKINCFEYYLTTQNYNTRVLNNCTISKEPAWTVLP